MKLNLNYTYARIVVSVFMLQYEVVTFLFFPIPRHSETNPGFYETQCFSLQLYCMIAKILFWALYLVLSLCVDKYNDNKRLQFFAYCVDFILVALLFLRLFRILPIL